MRGYLLKDIPFYYWTILSKGADLLDRNVSTLVQDRLSLLCLYGSKYSFSIGEQYKLPKVNLKLTKRDDNIGLYFSKSRGEYYEYDVFRSR